MTRLSFFNTAVLAAATLGAAAPACAQTFLYRSGYAPLYAPPAQPQQQPQIEMMEEDGQAPATEIRPELRRQLVDYRGREAAGTVIVDTPNKFLYYVTGNGKAMRYGIGVGRDGFTWSGTHNVARKAEWPDWYPPQEMLARQPYLPRMTAGGPGNPLGARAIYIGNTQYRIHGTNAPETIGRNVSSGCIRMLNEDVIDLYNRVQVGSKVVVLPDNHIAKRMMQEQVSAAPQDSPRPSMASLPHRGLY